MSFQTVNRALAQRAIKNASDLTTNNQHLVLDIKALNTRIQYIESNWEKFHVAHVRILLKATKPEDQAANNTLFDEVEDMYLTTLHDLQAQIAHIEQQHIAQQMAQQQPGFDPTLNDNYVYDPLDNSNGASNNVPDPNDGNNIADNANNYQNDGPNVAAEAAANAANDRHAQINPIVQPRPQQIFIQCGSASKVENTWGEFEGHLTKWKGFHDRFKVAVHDNPNISKAFKFQHLRTSLKGRAAATLGEWHQTEENYDEAWDRLNQLFNRPYQTTKELLNKFYDLPKLDKASGGMIQKFSNTAHEVLRQLRALRYPIEHFDCFFVHGIHAKLDPETSKQWELTRTSENPSINDMLDFLDRQATALFGTQFMSSNKDNHKRTGIGKEPDNQKRFKSNDQSGEKSDAKVNVYSATECPSCKENHPIYKCNSFLKLNVPDRKKFVNEKKLCRNCLGSNHFERNCKRGECTRCNIKHNYLLCPETPRNKESVVNLVQKRPEPQPSTSGVSKKKGNKQN